MSYQGLPEALRQEVLTRDHFRCRWCGATNQGGDLHHIEYRRGYSYDRLDNLVTLCRSHHSFAHGIPNGAGHTITKAIAQRVLRDVISKPGVTGSSAWRALKRQFELEGRCADHGERTDECLDCRAQAHAACAECGNDDPADGFKYCTDCLEQLVPQETS